MKLQQHLQQLHGQLQHVQQMQTNQKVTQQELLQKAYELQVQLRQAQNIAHSSSPISDCTNTPTKEVIIQRIAEWEHQYALTVSRTNLTSNNEIPFPGTQFDEIPSIYQNVYIFIEYILDLSVFV